MDLKLGDQSVIVFGAARGIGLAIARQFAAEGAKVQAVDVSYPSDETLSEVKDSQSISFVQADVTDFDAMKALAATNEPQHVIYCVGVGSGRPAFPFWNLEPSDWPRVIDVNLMGAVNVAHAFAPMLAEQRTGTMLFLASVAAQIGSPTDPPYSAAKAALINFMQCAARDLGEYTVRVNALSPGMVKTDLNRSVWAANQQLLSAEQQQSYEEWTDEKIRRISLLGRWQTAEECAAVAVFLASDLACNITGQTINVDGGQVMHS